MIKKLQNVFILCIFIMLLLLTLPGYYLIIKEQSDNCISIIILVVSQLFVLLSISIAIKNIFISFIIKSFSNESNSISFEIINKKSFSIKAFQTLSKIFVIIIMGGYCLVYLLMSLQYMVIYSAMFIVVYSLSINIIPDKLLFLNNECIIYNKINNILFLVKSYRIEGCKCTLFLSNNSTYDIFIEDAEIEHLIKMFEAANSEYNDSTSS